MHYISGAKQITDLYFKLKFVLIVIEKFGIEADEIIQETLI